MRQRAVLHAAADSTSSRCQRTEPCPCSRASIKTADACLTWEPGQLEPSAITPPGSKGEQIKISGCFLMIVPGQQEELGELREDGFVWMLSDTSWRAVKHALSEGQALALLIDGKRLRIEWVAA